MEVRLHSRLSILIEKWRSRKNKLMAKNKGRRIYFKNISQT